MIDLNCDMGELPVLLADGTQEALLAIVSSVNIACGGHAGDEQMMAETIEAALRNGVRVGAHPSYPDREGFGRRPLAMSADELANSIERQLTTLMAVAARCGAKLAHGKPHGALYNVAAQDPVVAAAVATGFARVLPNIPLMGRAGSLMLDVFAAHGFPTLPEGFVDRRYEADGSLRARVHADALIVNPEATAAQAVSIARDGVVETLTGERVRVTANTLCIHSDTAGSVAIAGAVRRALEAVGCRVGAGNSEEP